MNGAIIQYNKITKLEYKKRHDKIVEIINWNLCEKYRWEVQAYPAVLGTIEPTYGWTSDGDGESQNPLGCKYSDGPRGWTQATRYCIRREGPQDSTLDRYCSARRHKRMSSRKSINIPESGTGTQEALEVKTDIIPTAVGARRATPQSLEKNHEESRDDSGHQDTSESCTPRYRTNTQKGARYQTV